MDLVFGWSQTSILYVIHLCMSLSICVWNASFMCVKGCLVLYVLPRLKALRPMFNHNSCLYHLFLNPLGMLQLRLLKLCDNEARVQYQQPKPKNLDIGQRTILYLLHISSKLMQPPYTINPVVHCNLVFKTNPVKILSSQITHWELTLKHFEDTQLPNSELTR